MIKRLMTYARMFVEFLLDIYKNRDLILTLTKRDLKSRYLGSAFGLIWAFAQPTVTIFVMWFVFQYGLRTPPVIDFPFSLWLISGLIPWFFLSETVQTATSAVLEYSFLVKNVTVRLSVLPIVKILAALIVHGFLVLLMFGFYGCYGIAPDIYCIQIIYYLFSGIVLLLGISWATSSVILFVRDVGQAVTIVTQLAFWATPIIWNINLVPPRYQWIVKLNPIIYIIEGYRDALIYKVWFWEHPAMSMYFWGFTVFVFCCGALMFKRLRPHFADVI